MCYFILLRLAAWYWLLSALLGVGLLSTMALSLQGCGFLREPIQCQPSAKPIKPPGPFGLLNLEN
jgi:hypothetical protein